MKEIIKSEDEKGKSKQNPCDNNGDLHKQFTPKKDSVENSQRPAQLASTRLIR
jgi:hypothetical protein